MTEKYVSVLQVDVEYCTNVTVSNVSDTQSYNDYWLMLISMRKY